MPYRRTENVARRLASRHAAIIAAARAVVSENGLAGAQIVPVAERAGIAAGTVYRYFSGKTDLVAALVADVSDRELAMMRRAAEDAPGPLSALCAAIMTFAGRALRQRRLLFASLAEPIEPDLDRPRLAFRKAVIDEFSARIAAAIAARYLPEQDTALAGVALLGLLADSLVGPMAPAAPERGRETVQAIALLALRALGIADARARGLVVQTRLPTEVAGDPV